MSVSQCVLRIEVDEDLPDMGDTPAEIEAAKEQKKKDRGARESKTITVETYASVLMGPNSDTGILPTSSRRSPPDDAGAEETISFFFGNPLVEVTKGVLHLYKENELKETTEAKTLCLLAVPGALGATDLLAFAAACQQDIAHVRVLRDGSPDHYMALLTFRTTEAAREFHSAFDGVPYSSLEPGALCRTAWVARVDCARSALPPPQHTELPTCPVCLERMDESVAGVLSVQCAHAFHAACLARWGGARCPVCRATQVPEPRDSAKCAQCEKDQDGGEEEGSVREFSRSLPGVAEGLDGGGGVEGGSLWICLICGNVGCGRYEGGHAAKHFLASNHTYALQLGSDRVWDYAGDNFVHRLVQNKTDGKLVAAAGREGEGEGETEKKLDAAQLDFTYILTQQLDAQRAFYEDKIAKVEATLQSERASSTARVVELQSESADLRRRLATAEAHAQRLDAKVTHLTNKVSTLSASLSEERSLGAALAAARAHTHQRAETDTQALQLEIAELKEQLRDVMFFVEARDKLQTEGTPQEELASASVAVAPPPKPRRKRR